MNTCAKLLQLCTMHTDCICCGMHSSRHIACEQGQEVRRLSYVLGLESVADVQHVQYARWIQLVVGDH